MNEISNRLSEVRRARGESAADLAHRVGVSRQAIHAMEAGGYSPNTAVALKLARELEVPVEELFWLDESEGATLEPGWRGGECMRTVLLPFAVLGLAFAGDEQRLDLCRLMREPAKLAGKVVEVKGYLKPLMHGTYLKQEGCELLSCLNGGFMLKI